MRMSMISSVVSRISGRWRRVPSACSRWATAESLHGVERALAPLTRVERLPRGVVDGHVEQSQQRWLRRLQRFVESQQLASHPLADLAQVVPVLDLEVTLEEVDHWQVARCLAVGDRGAFEDQPALEPMRVGELIDEARLADAGLADDRRHLTMAAAGELLGTAELLQLGVAADERRQSAPGGRLQAGPRRTRPRHLVDLHRVGQPLHRHEAERLHLDVALGQRQRLGRDHDRARISDLLHPRGQVGRLADGRVVHVEITADGAHNDFPGVQPDADLDHRRVRASHLLRIRLHGLLHPECRVAGAHGVIFVGERRAEQRHDPVAHHLVDRSLVAVDGLHHPFEDWIENLARFLGIAIGEQLHRPLEVGEEHSHLFALPLEGALGVYDFLGEVLRRVGLGRCESRLSGCL
jgi:hypothetical protein